MNYLLFTCFDRSPICQMLDIKYHIPTKDELARHRLQSCVVRRSYRKCYGHEDASPRVIQVIVRFVLKLETPNYISQCLVYVRDDHIRLRISHRDHFLFDSVIIDTHIMEILPNELATMVKGYNRRSRIKCEPFLLNNVGNCY